MVPFEILSHTADTGVEATAGTFPDLVAELARGMFALMAEGPTGDTEITVTVSGDDPAEVAVDALAELLWAFETEDLWLSDISATAVGDALTLTARGTPLTDVEVTGPPIKAVTYHDVSVTEGPDGWRGRVYFDV